MKPQPSHNFESKKSPNNDEKHIHHITINLDLKNEPTQNLSEPNFEAFKFNRASKKSKRVSQTTSSENVQKLVRNVDDKDTSRATSGQIRQIEAKVTILNKTTPLYQDTAHSDVAFQPGKTSRKRPVTYSKSEGKMLRKPGAPGAHDNLKELERLAPEKKTKPQQGSLDPHSELIHIDDDGEHASASAQIGKAFVPWWTRKEYIKDKKLRRPDDPDYDPTTIHLPKDVLSAMKPFYKLYWQIKSEYYDKLVGIKIGETYAFYYQDALVFHRVLDFPIRLFQHSTCCYMGEQAIYKFIARFIELGYSVALVDQLAKNKGKEADLIERELTQVITQSSFYDHPTPSYQPSYALALFEFKNTVGTVLMEPTSHTILLAEFQDDDSRSNLRTLLTKYQPCEVVYLKEHIHRGSLALINSMPCKPKLIVSRLVGPKKVSEIVLCLSAIIAKDSNAKLPEFVDEFAEIHYSALGDAEAMDEAYLLQMRKKFFLLFQALAMGINYLEYLIISDVVLPIADYQVISVPEDVSTNLYLDSQALEHLEILHSSYFGSESERNSLFGLMNMTKTPYGARLFRRWLVSPLVSSYSIEQRVSAVDDLLNSLSATNKLQEALSKLPDLERMVSKIYNYLSGKILKAYRYRTSVFTKIHEFLELMKAFMRAREVVCQTREEFADCTSGRLKALLSLRQEEQEDNSKLFPNYLDAVAKLQAMVVMKDDLPTPAPGYSKEIDGIFRSIDLIKAELQEHLTAIRMQLGCNAVCYVHSKSRFELEVPEELVSGAKKPDDFVLTSKRKGFPRFHTIYITERLERLAELEAGYKSSVVPFMIDYFNEFRKHHKLWKQAVACLAELDSLCSLAMFSHRLGTRCRPQFVEQDEGSKFELTDMIHPYLLSSREKEPVPNSTMFESSKQIKLITGPNMGGKSTLLRQSSLAIIMAQVGSYVPASRFVLTPVDRIFYSDWSQ